MYKVQAHRLNRPSHLLIASTPIIASTYCLQSFHRRYSSLPICPSPPHSNSSPNITFALHLHSLHPIHPSLPPIRSSPITSVSTIISTLRLCINHRLQSVHRLCSSSPVTACHFDFTTAITTNADIVTTALNANTYYRKDIENDALDEQAGVGEEQKN